jgi:hypothetical protein
MAEHGDPRNEFSDFKERSTQFMPHCSFCREIDVRFSARTGLRTDRKEFRKPARKVKLPLLASPVTI